MMLDADIGDIRVHVSTEGHPPSVRLGVPYRAGQRDIIMTFEAAEKLIDTLQDLMARAKINPSSV